ncbi:Stk1 family PASTA domain-containing Ser/Thr kinase [Microbacterium sp. G2-8]|uniref:Stk1 family PASTA domain-containing Ser/Thr kinase n=1 Tax=Microbacterium sp. G2-8 TaxID=2842454 RepID=UPI0027E2F429|nr:Stk1 family PASTA domain-containing Ser/Thr kinase [Microbacterium sp. G2-8]
MSEEPTQALPAPVQTTRVLSGRYRVDSLIGRGGMASVYRGYDETLGRTVAIKILRSDFAHDNTFRTRFRLEAQAASRMAHPSIVRVYDAGEDLDDDGAGGTRHTPFIIMELVRGTLLKDIISSGPVPTDDAARYVDGILEALEYSHRAGVVHRDIKPANVMVTDHGQVKVMDFGIARAVSDTSATVAETTTILGTASYFSPEQAQGDAVDARADIYSTGIVLYELLTGRPPFRGDSPVAVAYQHVREAPVPPSRVDENAPPQLDPIVLRALAKDPAQRFADAATFREELDAALDGKSMTKRQLAVLTDQLYGAQQQQQAETEHTLTQLSSDNGIRRTQSGPPIAWVWAAVALLVALVAAVVFWVVTQDPLELRAADSVEVADVTDMTYERAAQELEGAELSVTRASEPHDTVEEGVVIRTDPAAGTPVTPGASIEVVVSQGEQLVAVPELVGLSEQAAREALEGAGLQLGRLTPVNDPENSAGTVLSAEIESDAVAKGDEVLDGAVVDLTVASGRVTVNNFADPNSFTVESAKAELEALQLTVEVVDDDTCEAETTPTVHTQSVVGDVTVGSSVTLYTCTGDGSAADDENSSGGSEGNSNGNGNGNGNGKDKDKKPEEGLDAH